MGLPKRKVIFQPSIFRGYIHNYVKLQGVFSAMLQKGNSEGSQLVWPEKPKTHGPLVSGSRVGFCNHRFKPIPWTPWVWSYTLRSHSPVRTGEVRYTTEGHGHQEDIIGNWLINIYPYHPWDDCILYIYTGYLLYKPAKINHSCRQI